MSDQVIGGIAVREVTGQGMVTLRGDLGSAAVKKAVKAAAGTEVPGQRQVLLDGGRGAAWMSPDELMVFVPRDEAGAAVEAMSKALGDAHSLVVDVSDARAVFEIEGPWVRELLAKLAPVDLAPGRFVPGAIRRTHLAQVPAAFWMTGEEAFHVICFRSVGAYMRKLLETAAEGGPVALF